MSQRQTINTHTPTVLPLFTTVTIHTHTHTHNELRDLLMTDDWAKPLLKKEGNCGPHHFPTTQATVGHLCGRERREGELHQCRSWHLVLITVLKTIKTLFFILFLHLFLHTVPGETDVKTLENTHTQTHTEGRERLISSRKEYNE